MSIASGPDGISYGLVCCLDPGNVKSYPGSGTTIYDLSGNNNHGTLTNGPTFSAVNGGVIVLDGTNDYINVPSINLSSGDYTVIGAARYVGSYAGRTFSARNNNWLMGHWAGYVSNYYAEGWVSASSAGGQDQNWRVYGAWGSSTSDIWGMYVNGVQDVAQNSNGSAGPNGFTIGATSSGTSEFSNSHIGVFMCYNRILSPSELKRTFESLKSRYSL